MKTRSELTSGAFQFGSFSMAAQIDPTTCERDYSADEIEFMHALDEYKRANGRMFPTCSEILEVIRGLGYERIVPPLMEPSTVTTDAPMDMPDLFARLRQAGHSTLAYPIREYWVDIGHMADYQRANTEFPEIFF